MQKKTNQTRRWGREVLGTGKWDKHCSQCDNMLYHVHPSHKCCTITDCKGFSLISKLRNSMHGMMNKRLLWLDDWLKTNEPVTFRALRGLHYWASLIEGWALVGFFLKIQNFSRQGGGHYSGLGASSVFYGKFSHRKPFQRIEFIISPLCCRVNVFQRLGISVFTYTGFVVPVCQSGVWWTAKEYKINNIGCHQNFLILWKFQ